MRFLKTTYLHPDLTFYMKKFVIVLLSVIFVTLVTGSVQSVAGDHLEPGQGIYVSDGLVNLVKTKDTNYEVYLHVITRTGDGQLISVVENMMDAAYIPHEITDRVFDTKMGKKEIVTIDNIKYEKVQYMFSPSIYGKNAFNNQGLCNMENSLLWRFQGPWN